MARRVTLVVLAAALLGGLLALSACAEDWLELTPQTRQAKPGEAVTYEVVWVTRQFACGTDEDRQRVTEALVWTVDGVEVPADGIRSDTPGEHTVRAVIADPKAEGVSGTAKLVVSGEATGGVSLSVDTPEPVDPSTLEQIMLAGNDQGVYNGGKPVTFTMSERRRVREVGTYHYNDMKGTTAGGTITIEKADGTVVGTFEVTRMTEGQGGVPNAYWRADVDFVLEPGTYVLKDSDPATWSQNEGTNGAGMSWLMVVKE